MNSARVAGGAAPAPLHSSWPEPQSPVEHEPWPEPSKLQPVRPQKRPDHPVGAWKERVLPLASSKPVLSSLGVPALARIPGHTVKSHLFVNVNVAPVTPAFNQRKHKHIYGQIMNILIEL